jgi:rhamnosyltransferase
MLTIFAIVVTYNADNDFSDNLSSYINQVDKVIIVDNGSSQNTIAQLIILKDKYLDKIIIIFNNQNLGIATAQNIGITTALLEKNDFIIFFDHDSKAKDDMITKLKEAYYELNKTEVNIGMLAANSIDQNCKDYNNKFLTSKDNITFKKQGFNKSSNYLEVISAISSGSMIKSDLFKKIGDFREDFFIDYVDFEYCLRLISSGYKIFAIKDAILYHALGNMKSIDFFRFKIIILNHSPKRRYTIYRNRIKVWKLYYNKIPAFVFFDLLSSFYFFAKVMLFEQNKLANFSNIVKGIYAGLKS